jgi:hypothetical protein
VPCRPEICKLGRVSGSRQCDSEDSRLLGNYVSVGESPVYTLRKKFQNCTPWTFSENVSELYLLITSFKCVVQGICIAVSKSCRSEVTYRQPKAFIAIMVSKTNEDKENSAIITFLQDLQIG